MESVVRNLPIAMVEEALVVFRHAAAHAVAGYFDDRIAVIPTHRAGLAIVGDLPGFGRDFDECLVAVIVVDGLEQFF